MKYQMPDNHGLSDTILEHLVPKIDGGPSLTDIQFDALSAGVGIGESALIVSPTSTGKTLIALWAIAKGIEDRGNTVYLVTHRALANQKFEEFQKLLRNIYFKDSLKGIVLATGDTVIDGEGDSPTEPLASPLVVATYEKYMALLSSSGIPTNMTSTVIVCDEIQLIGDKNRGKNVEILLTLLKNAGWRQLVGLSAVLDRNDVNDLAAWLGLVPVLQYNREKHLIYECWTDEKIVSVNSMYSDHIDESRKPNINTEPLSILHYLLKQKKPPVPIIVFCMRKQDTYDLPETFIRDYLKAGHFQPSLAFEEFPETTTNAALSRAFSHKIGIHSSDLTDEERQVVEDYLLKGKLDVVFATSTLAAGVNFPFGAAIFSKWKRWDFDRRQHVPIESDEFHNMAGRVGRMGYGHECGRIIFISETGYDLRIAKQFLALDSLPCIESRIKPVQFDLLVLQLVAAGICGSENDVEKVVNNTFSAIREQDRNTKEFEKWPLILRKSLSSLLENGFLIKAQNGKISPTPVGKALSFTGLTPDTGAYILSRLAQNIEGIVGLLPSKEKDGNLHQFGFIIFSICFFSPEFRPMNGNLATRFLPYPLANIYFDIHDEFKQFLNGNSWFADPAPINAAQLCVEWMEGAALRSLEDSAPGLRAGMIREMHRNLVWMLNGLSQIILAVADPRVPQELLPKSIKDYNADLKQLIKIPRVAKRLAFRIDQGLPDEVLWMTVINSLDSKFKLTREEILNLRELGYVSPEQLMSGDDEADEVRIRAFTKFKPAPQPKANWLRDMARKWKVSQRKWIAGKHIERAAKCTHRDLVSGYYICKGEKFETIFEDILAMLNVEFIKLDQKGITGAPDYLIKFQESPDLVVELKSKEGDRLVDYNKATEVLSASEIHGLRECFCVTLCHPGVEPSVPTIISSCSRLCVVESHDLGEALLRLCEGQLKQKQIWQWLASPGQAVISDLPFKEYS